MKWGFLAVLALGCGSSAPPPPAAPAPSSAAGAADAPAASTPSSPAATAPATAPGPVAATGNRCDALPVSELAIDGLLDDWAGTHVVARVGAAADGAIAVRCAWDGSVLALAIRADDDRLIRVKGGHEDRVTLALSAGGKPVAVTVYPGNPLAKARILKPARVSAADSLQPEGFSVELAIPASAIPALSAATSALQLDLVFHDSDAATGGDTQPLAIQQPLELGERKDLFDDFLAAVRLRKADIKVDVAAELDPDRKGKERLVAGGTAIGILTDQFAYVTLPAATAADVLRVELLPLGPRGQQVVAALVRQGGNGGSRELLMLWTVWSGQLQPLASIEVKKEVGANVLATSWRIVKGKHGAELWVEARPAVGFTAETWNEIPAADLDPIVLPWDPTKSGVAYRLTGAELARRDLPPAKKPKR